MWPLPHLVLSGWPEPIQRSRSDSQTLRVAGHQLYSTHPTTAHCRQGGERSIKHRQEWTAVKQHFLPSAYIWYCVISLFFVSCILYCSCPVWSFLFSICNEIVADFRHSHCCYTMLYPLQNAFINVTLAFSYTVYQPHRLSMDRIGFFLSQDLRIALIGLWGKIRRLRHRNKEWLTSRWWSQPPNYSPHTIKQ